MVARAESGVRVLQGYANDRTSLTANTRKECCTALMF